MTIGKLITIFKILFLLSTILLVYGQLAFAAKYSQSARVDVRIGNPPNCVFNVAPVPDVETPCGWPATGYISTVPFEPDTTHTSLSAIDIASEDQQPGLPIYATHDGVAQLATQSQPDPFTPDIKVLVSSSKYTTKYQHLLKQCVADGANVVRGTLIGLMDNTGYSFGNHLHYEIVNSDGAELTPEQFNLLVPAYGSGDSVKASYTGETTC